MDGSSVTDFSIERILSPELGLRPHKKDRAADPFLQSPPVGPPVGYFTVPVPVSGPGCLQHREVNFRDFYPYGDFRFHPNHRVYLHFSPHEPTGEITDSQHLPGYHGCHQAAVSAQPQQRQKPRMRTVFTDTQCKQLEALFESTHYPSVEARAEVARRTGLSEETVRVWFKNRRARRKRQLSGSKVKSPSPPPRSGPETRIFSSFL